MLLLILTQKHQASSLPECGWTPDRRQQLAENDTRINGHSDKVGQVLAQMESVVGSS